MSESIVPTNNEDKLWAGLGYAGLAIWMIPTLVIFFLKKDESPYIKFHLLQALGLGIVEIIFMIGWMILSFIPVIGWLVLPLIGFFVAIALFAYWIVLMIWAFTGKAFKIPVLGDFVEQQFMK